jgi:hypothetical protein
MTDESSRSKVFISHASEDKDRFVLEFAKRLRENGVDAWVDVWEMLPGDSLVDKVYYEGIKNARAMIVVLSNYSVEKPWVREELNRGFLDRLRGKCRIIPVVIDDCPIPEPLRSTIWQKIDNLDDYETEFNRILDAIYGRINKPPLGSPPEMARRAQLIDDLINNHGIINLNTARYTQEDVESFLLDKFESPTIRLPALEVYLSSSNRSAPVLGELIYDPDAGIRRKVMRYIHNNPSSDLYDLFDNEKIKKILGDPELETAVSATRLACDLVEAGKIDRKVLTSVGKHTYWLVRRIAIDCIVKLDVPDALELLFAFKNTNYHVSQKLIRDYINSHYKDFDADHKKLAIELLEHLANAKRISDTSKKKNIDLINKIRDIE